MATGISGYSSANITSDAKIYTDITFAEGADYGGDTGGEPEYSVAIKIQNGRLESNQEISARNVVVTNTTPYYDTELTSKFYVDTLIAQLNARIDAMT